MKKSNYRRVCALHNLSHLIKLVVFCLACITTSILSADDKLDWSWKLERAALYDSLISIQNKGNQLTQHEFTCNLSDAVKIKTVEDPASSIDTVITSSHPKGLLVVTCNVGAHSEEIVIIDPTKQSQQIAFRKTGSYFVEWEIVNDLLHIRYDHPREKNKADSEENSFETVEIIFQ